MHVENIFFIDMQHRVYYDFFFNWQTEKKTCFGPIRNFISFSTAQTKKNLWKKIVENKILFGMV